MNPSFPFALLLSCSAMYGATSAQDEEATRAPEELVEQLGDKQFSLREQASNALWEMGKAALPALRSAQESLDPELAYRASMLIQNIESGIFPTTDKEVLNAISEYNDAHTFQSKRDAIQALTQLKAYKQALYLLRNESDGELRLKLTQDRVVRRIALSAAHGEAAEGRLDEAISILRLAPKESFNLRALAQILYSSGQLDAELNKLPAEEGDDEQKLWKLILLQAKGDLEELKLYAEQQSMSEVSAVIAMMEGNPHLVINELIKSSNEVIHTSALNTLKSVFQQNSIKPAHKLTGSFKGEVDDTTTLYQSAISMLLGERVVGEALLDQGSNALALSYYQSLESSTEILTNLGQPDYATNSQDFKKWVSGEIDKEFDLDRNHLNEEASSKLLTLAHFYHDRGDKGAAEYIYTEFLSAAKKLGEDKWNETLITMPQHGMAELMMRFIAEAQLDQDRLTVLSHMLFGDTDDVANLWKFLVESGSTKPFLSLCSLMGIPNQSNIGEQLERDILNKHKNAEAHERVEVLEALGYAAEQRGDYVKVLAYFKQLSALDSNNARYITKYRGAAELQMNWQEVVDSYDLNDAYYSRNSVGLTRYAVAQRKLGNKELYDQLMQRAHILSLGISKTLNGMAMVLHEAGYADDALSIWIKNIIHCSVLDWDLYMTLNYINHVSYELVNQKKWRLASSLAIVESALYMEPNAHPLSNTVRPLRMGFAACFTYGMALLENGKKKQAVEFLNHAHNSLIGDGVLANHFFPSLISVDLKKQREHWFEASWRKLEKEIKNYPEAHNTRNTIAWLGARAVTQLDEAKQHSEIALRIQPDQPAYLDTLAEVYFAMGDRKSAVKTSNRALETSITRGGQYRRRSSLSEQQEAISMMYWDLTHQHKRFEKSALPSSSIKN